MGVLTETFVWRVVWRVLVLVLGAVVVYLAVTAVQVWLTSRRSDPHSAEAVVVMGAAQYNGVPSPDLRARLEEADDLFHRGLAPLIVVTGYKEPGDHYTEAQAGAAWLTDHGVPAYDVVQAGGSDSWQNLSDAAAALRQRDLDDVLIVTDGFHEDRSMAIASSVGLRASPVPATDSPIRGWAALPYFIKEAVGVALGRVIGFSHLHDLGARAGAA